MARGPRHIVVRGQSNRERRISSRSRLLANLERDNVACLCPAHHREVHLGVRAVELTRWAKTRRQTCGFAGAEVEGGLKVFSLGESRSTSHSLELNAIAFCSGVHCRQQMEQQRGPADGETRPQQLRRARGGGLRNAAATNSTGAAQVSSRWLFLRPYQRLYCVQ
jgi:hypothetical protein